MPDGPINEQQRDAIVEAALQELANLPAEKARAFIDAAQRMLAAPCTSASGVYVSKLVAYVVLQEQPATESVAATANFDVATDAVYLPSHARVLRDLLTTVTPTAADWRGAVLGLVLQLALQRFSPPPPTPVYEPHLPQREVPAAVAPATPEPLRACVPAAPGPGDPRE